jgi:hypothetical protein
MAHRELTPQEMRDLATALAGIMKLGQLQQLVHLATGDRMDEAYVSPQSPLPLRGLIYELLMALETVPSTDLFLREVYWEYPGQTALREAILALYPEIGGGRRTMSGLFSVQSGGKPVRGAEAAPPALQSIVRKALKRLPIRVWLDRIGTIERQVCRVEAMDRAFGTGFLVGPDAVLTNWHVVAAARAKGLEAALECRFDYRLLTGGGRDPGVKVGVAEIMMERPASPSERNDKPDEPPVPTEDELDFALLRLVEPQAARGHIPLAPPPPLAEDDPIMIVQHPAGDPMDFTLDTSGVIGRVGAGRRLRYRTNTLSGSSGSPCLTMDLDLVALHHLGDPAYGPANSPAYNQGVPIELVRDSIIKAGHGAAIGA